VYEVIELKLSEIKQFVVELLALILEYLVCVFFTTTHSLEFRQVFAAWQHLLELNMLFFVSFELDTDTL